jgi:hypothetical protein
MSSSRQCFFHVRLKNFDTRNTGLTPVLSASVSVSVSTGGASSGVLIPNGDAKRVCFEILGIASTLRWVSDSRKLPSAMPLVATGGARTLKATTLVLDATYSADFEIDFQLPPTILSVLEEFRAGGDPAFAIEMRLSGLARLEFEPPLAAGVPFLSPFVAEDVFVVRHDTGSYVLEIEKSKWIEKLLPGLGFGRWMVYEVPVENFDGSAQADVYLQNAVRQFLAGEYKLSVAASRDVVETLERELGANANPAFGDHFGSGEKKLRKVTDSFAELVQAMLNYEAALKSLLAAGAHPERPDEHVERPDAELALWVALSLRRYVGMRLRTTRPPPSTADASG